MPKPSPDDEPPAGQAGEDAAFRPRGVEDNIDGAVFSKLNALAERYGLKPYDFIAMLHSGPENEDRLVFESSPKDDLGRKKFDQMARALGIPDDIPFLQATLEQMVDSLDRALELAPVRRSR